ncbi:NifB/NifX family molybdenum-iron cluster-binding protein [Thermoanaerobacterium thermosaccharolyticum]
MIHRIAIASRDGKMVNEHFGHARRFIIVDLYDD